ncbi:MAG: TonB-dependent receptor [Prevotellaceae bacterium]|jgi:TonB-linked SusC/RagA family outer membrane protein|nr:TonB-dependent receptor [Prevotellaceae bacterium]
MKKILSIAFLTLLSMGVMSGQTKVTGKVTDLNTNDPVSYASVAVKGYATAGTFTDDNGNYTINMPEGSTTLVFSFVGYKTQEVVVNNRSIIDVSLESDVAQIEESIVVAYGTVKSKESFTGSVSVVKGEDIQKRSVSSVTKALEGVAAGVITTSGGGQPGSDARILIRGIGSINSSTNPLFVVDGIPFDGSFSSINQNDIESMSILKDAAATSLYGSRANNGVILITTKKGTKGRTNINYKGSIGISSRSLKRYDGISQKETVEMIYEAYKNYYMYDGGRSVADAKSLASNELSGYFGGEYYNPFRKYTWQTLIDPATGKVKPDAVSAWNDNWMDEITENNALRQEHVISLSGGSENTSHLISLGYLDEQGVLRTTKFTRFSVRANIDHQAKDWLKAGANLSYAYTKTNAHGSGSSQTSIANVWNTAQFMNPVYPLYLKDKYGNNVFDKDGNILFDYGNGKYTNEDGYSNDRSRDAGWNAVGDLFNDKYTNNRDNIGIRSYIEFGSDKESAGIFRGLKLKINFGGDLTNSALMDYAKTGAPGGYIYKDNYRDFSYTLNQLLTWSRTFGKHSVDFLAGHEYYDWRGSYLAAERTQLIDGIYELAPGVNLTGGTSSTDVDRIESYLTRINYGFDDRYYLSASWRIDGSSRFHKDHRWGQFWSLGASWKISDEKFMKNIEFVNNLSLKASYGLIGNQNLSTYYAWQSFYDITMANADQQGALISTLENPNVSWEESKEFNIGISASLFNRIVNLEFEFYNRNTTKMLMQARMPTSTGFTYYNTNMGSMNNKGIEAVINVKIFNKENFKWNTTLSLSHNKNKVTDIPDPQTGMTVIEEGKEIYTYYLPKSAGVDPATGALLYWAYKKKEENGVELRDANKHPIPIPGSDYITSDRDLANTCKYYFGSRQPKLTGAFSSDFVIFKNFDVSFLTTFSIGGKIYENRFASIMQPRLHLSEAFFSNQTLRRWQKPGDITDVPRLEVEPSALATDRFLINASYFAVKNVTVGYTLPEKITKKIDIKSLRVFCTLDNFIMFNYLNGMDPQYNFTGSTAYTYAPTRSFSIGLDINF